MSLVFVSTYPFDQMGHGILKTLKESGTSVELNRTERKMTSIEVAEAAVDAVALIAGTEDLRELGARTTRLRLIARVGIGLDGVPLEECRRKGIRVCWTPDAVTMAVAEMTVGLMLATSRHLIESDHELRRNVWNRRMGRRLQESKIGLIGFGRVGMKVASLLATFSPREVMVTDIMDRSEEVEHLRGGGLNIRSTRESELIEESHIVSLHVPLTSQTARMFDEPTLFSLQRGAILINTARGGIIDERALEKAISEEHLAAAAIDVFEEEPYVGPLTKYENIMLSPHLGSCSIDCRAEMERVAADEVVRFLSSAPLLSEVPSSEYSQNLP